MPSSKNAVVLVVISFILVILIYSSVAKFDVFARTKTEYTGCTKRDPTKSGATSAIECCWTNTEYGKSGRITAVYSTCQTCEYDANGNKIDCRNTSPSRSTGLGNPPQSVGSAQPPSTPLPPPPSNAIPPPSAFSSPTKQQTLTTTCPDGSAPDANGNCPPTTNTNQHGELTSNNNNPQQGHHHTGNNNHKGSKTDQGTTQPP
jgi:hypothetical protein